MPRKKKLYVVGYDDDHQYIYGKDRNGQVQTAEPMTEIQAKKGLEELKCKGGTIYKLVPVKLKGR